MICLNFFYLCLDCCGLGFEQDMIVDWICIYIFYNIEIQTTAEPASTEHQRKNVLLFCETSEVSPVSREVFKLVSVDGNEHQHGVGHNKPPEEFQQTPPQRIVHLRSIRNSIKRILELLEKHLNNTKKKCHSPEVPLINCAEERMRYLMRYLTETVSLTQGSDPTW